MAVDVLDVKTEFGVLFIKLGNDIGKFRVNVLTVLGCVIKAAHFCGKLGCGLRLLIYFGVSFAVSSEYLLITGVQTVKLIVEIFNCALVGFKALCCLVYVIFQSLCLLTVFTVCFTGFLILCVEFIEFVFLALRGFRQRVSFKVGNLTYLIKCDNTCCHSGDSRCENEYRACEHGHIPACLCRRSPCGRRCFTSFSSGSRCRSSSFSGFQCDSEFVKSVLGFLSNIPRIVRKHYNPDFCANSHYRLYKHRIILCEFINGSQNIRACLCKISQLVVIQTADCFL